MRPRPKPTSYPLALRVRFKTFDVKRLKALEEENAKLKKLLAEHMMDVSTLRGILTKNF